MLSAPLQGGEASSEQLSSAGRALQLGLAQQEP